MGLGTFFKSFFDKPAKPQAAIAVGGFEAAAWTRDRSIVWGDGSSAATDTYSRLEIARLARYLVRNYPLFERILSVSEIYGIGSGLIANPTTGDDTFDAAASNAFDKWASSAFCTVSNGYSFYEAQKLLVRELLITGEAFIVLIKSPITNYPQIMLVRSEDVRKSDEPGDDSINGLYVDKFGKVTAYNIFSGSSFQKVDASNVVHLQLIKEIGQLRGYSVFASSLNSARDKADLLALEKKAVKTHSALAAVVRKKDGQASNGLFGDVTPQPTVQKAPRANAGLERAFGGSVSYLNEGEDVTLLASERSTAGFFNFLECLAREVCLSVSLPYEFLVNADKLTGTGVRFAIADAAAFFGNLQNVLIDGGIQRIYSWVIASFIKDGTLAAPANVEPWAVAFTKPLSLTVDLTKASNVEISLMQNSMLTFESYYSARGKNWVHELRQKAKEEKFLNELSRETGVEINRLRTLAAGAPAIQSESPNEDSAAQEAA